MEMLGRIVQKLVELPAEKLGLLYDLLEKLAGPLGQQWWRELAKFLRRENPFAISDIQSEWQEFYRKYFHISVDFSNVSIPDDPGDFGRVIFMPKGLKFNDVIKAMRKYFSVWSSTGDLDGSVNENVRHSDHSYAIRIRERVEADEEFKNLSANQLEKRGVNCMTLLERLVYELKYFSETGQHLDVREINLCAGSRYSSGNVPLVSWHVGSDKLNVNWCRPGDASDVLRARPVVS